ncbi:tRNA (guanosine(46)-N7)-methyltransferase TrmB [Kineobactrum sediminis]|uniref:tRNA (guanine-N(7)-)-methyltransferase n=1 Tax=Kineobactrum sediminis TaxID=1905677 RepID=A0A2N5Y528_9GAMM|nr:tRNA (guanosine(46)-N7)-methyltransferase TrmB [Kineobactrum sediminis]PLW83503.1 tRNA (guanosine(46)-N7)-methyltransferase TrmB [Kineobactrum sediminis]
MTDSVQQRPIRSYVLRMGRLTPGQQRAYDENWSHFGLLHGDGAPDFDVVFGRTAPRVLEIGFGMGESLVTMAAAAPEKDFIGIEVHRPGVGKLLHTMAEREVGNIRAYCHDAVEVLRDCIAESSLDTIQIFFPDPWHKKRHNKRRLIQPGFTAQLVRHLKPGGILHLATDWEDYAEQMLEVLSATPNLVNTAGVDQYAPRPSQRPLTKFELRGERLGHGVWDLVFQRPTRSAEDNNA